MPNQPFYYGGQYRNPLDAVKNPVTFQNTNEVFTALANIYPSRFVTIAGNMSVVQSMQGDEPIGVSQPNTAVWNQPYAATAGYKLQVFGNAHDCWLMAGGTFSAGALLRTDNLGRGIAITSGMNYCAAKAYEGGVEGQLVRVRVLNLGYVQAACGFSEFSFEYSNEFGVPC